MSKGPSFILAALPRSGTTWASAWLMDGNALCYHDPLGSGFTIEQLEEHDPGCLWGIACTSVFTFPQWMARQNCPVVLLDRPIDQINKSLVEELKLPPLNDAMLPTFQSLKFPRISWNALWTPEGAKEIWEFLRPDTPFNVQRWHLLQQLRINPKFEEIVIDTAKFRANMKQIYKEMYESL